MLVSYCVNLLENDLEMKTVSKQLEASSDVVKLKAFGKGWQRAKFTRALTSSNRNLQDVK